MKGKGKLGLAHDNGYRAAIGHYSGMNLKDPVVQANIRSDLSREKENDDGDRSTPADLYLAGEICGYRHLLRLGEAKPHPASGGRRRSPRQGQSD